MSRKVVGMDCTRIFMYTPSWNTVKNKEERYTRVPPLSHTRYSDYQIPFTQLKGPKRDGDREAAKQYIFQYMVMWASDRFKRYERFWALQWT